MDVRVQESHVDPASLTTAGWSFFEADGFNGVLGPIWTRRVDGERVVGFLSEARHSNAHVGTVHGGVLMTFADIALGFGVVELLGAPRCVTAQLQLHFVSYAHIGTFVTCRPEIIRKTSQLIFVRGLICVGDNTVASADGIWKVIEKKPAAT